MPDCLRCERPGEKDGVTLQETADGPLCVVCVSWRQEHGDDVRPVDQAGLEAYTTDDGDDTATTISGP